MVEEKLVELLPEELPVVIGDLAGSEDNQICILMQDGYGNTEFFGERYCSTVFEPLVKIVIRNKSYDEGKLWVETVREALQRYTDEDFISIMLIGTPMYLGKSLQKLHEFQLTFLVQIM